MRQRWESNVIEKRKFFEAVHMSDLNDQINKMPKKEQEEQKKQRILSKNQSEKLVTRLITYDNKERIKDSKLY